jgi:hypothetical protein
MQFDLKSHFITTKSQSQNTFLRFVGERKPMTHDPRGFSALLYGLLAFQKALRQFVM